MNRYAVYYRGIIIRDYRTGKDAIYDNAHEAMELSEELNSSGAGYYIDKAKVKRIKKEKVK